MNIYPLISDEETESERLNDVLKMTQQDLGLRLGTASTWLWYPSSYDPPLWPFRHGNSALQGISPGQAQPGLTLQPQPRARRQLPPHPFPPSQTDA